MIGERLKELRNKKGLTISKSAEIFGVAVRTYSSYESEEREPNITMMNKMADFYEVTVDYLLGREKPDDPLEVMGIKVRDIDDDAFIKMYRELPDNAKCVFLDVMKKLAGAGAKDEQENTAPDYGSMKHSAATGDIIADTEAEKDA